MNASVHLYGSAGDQFALILFAQELEEFLAREGVQAQVETCSEFSSLDLRPAY